jgi:hypothetical protein
MASNFPTSKQTFTDPQTTDALNSPSHAGLHTDMNDTVEAIQDKLGTAAQDNAPAANKFLRGTGANTSEWDIDFKDEDNQASDSATAVPSQQSVKAYVDNQTWLTGWIPSGETWTYASADDPTFTFTISGDKTAKYSAGMRIKLTQTTAKYFIITKVAYSSPDTTITVYGGTDYDLANAAITSPYYSIHKAPALFPLDPTIWTVATTDTSLRTGDTPTQNTWYNLTACSINIPIGCWNVYYRAGLQAADNSLTSNVTQVTLSTANNSESSSLWTSGNYLAATGATTASLLTSCSKDGVINITTKATYYLNVRTTASGQDAIYLNNDAGGALVIRAVCAYL